MVDINWTTEKGTSLCASDVYNILSLRCEVFQVERQILHQDADGLDISDSTYHIMGYTKDTNVLAAYCRVIFAGENAYVGRVVVKKIYRKMKLGGTVVERGLALIDELKDEFDSKYADIHAQYYLKDWYTKFGLEAVGEPFMEAGIKHLEFKKTL